MQDSSSDIHHRIHHRLYRGVVWHKRVTPVENYFKYRVFSVLLDLDELPKANTSLFGVNRLRLWSFYNRDHGPHENTPLRPWVEGQLNFKPDQIKLLAFPRLFGYVFKPLSVFFCYQNDTLKAVIYEVRNAYKHQHCYVEYINDQPPHQHGMQKQFYVSPYTPAEGYYKMMLMPPEYSEYALNINLYDKSDQLILIANHTGQSATFSDWNLFKYFWLYLLLPFKISGSILWQALKLRVKGLRFRTPGN